MTQAECEARGLVRHGVADTARALRILGIEAHTVSVELNWGARGPVCYTTNEGAETATMLRELSRVVTTTMKGLARRLANHPDVFAELRAAYSLDADAAVLHGYLPQLWSGRQRLRGTAKLGKKPSPTARAQRAEARRVSAANRKARTGEKMRARNEARRKAKMR